MPVLIFYHPLLSGINHSPAGMPDRELAFYYFTVLGYGLVKLIRRQTFAPLGPSAKQ